MVAVAQQVEHLTVNQKATGSSPVSHPVSDVSLRCQFPQIGPERLDYLTYRPSCWRTVAGISCIPTNLNFCPILETLRLRNEARGTFDLVEKPVES